MIIIFFVEIKKIKNNNFFTIICSLFAHITYLKNVLQINKKNFKKTWI